MKRFIVTFVFVVVSLILLVPAASPAWGETPSTKPTENFSPGLKWRLIGPFRGGRSLTAAGIPGNPNIYYFGAVSGGVWKSTNGGVSWNPIFDKEPAFSIGSLAVATSDPNILYVGTGEACIRGNVTAGDGVYKSTDAGKTWKNVGLTDTRHIGKLIIDPKNPDIVFVAALGHAYGSNAERGVFRTLDGGKTWQKVLFKDDQTGAIDIAFDPSNSNILFATLWEAHRTPYSLDDGGPGSGLYKSIDDGATWTELKGHGLPEGPYGRIGVAVAANSTRVYALIEAKQSGLYRSDDGGEKWQLVDEDQALWQRPWYYMHIVADPRNPEEVYVMNVQFFRSTDGGRHFSKIPLPHGDNHGLWIDPKDTQRMIESSDGGATITLDGGKTWSSLLNQPTAQFYHIITDNRFPYYLYGAQQDNSTVAIASRSNSSTIDRPDRYPVGGGESGYIAPYPPDLNIVFASGYQGTLSRFDKRTGQAKSISSIPMLTDALGAAPLPHRFNWTSPVLISPHDPKVLYHAGERLFKSTDMGMTWTAISPDLTRNDKTKQQVSGGDINKDDSGTEYYDTIFTVAESPVVKDEIWAGSDDGLVHLTRDGGKNWIDVTPKDMPAWGLVSLIEASPFQAGTAFMAVDCHKLDDLHPYIFKTTDYGKSWTKIVAGIPPGDFVHAVRQDPQDSQLLFAGTETGVFVSFDEGAQWQSLKLNLPDVPVQDLTVHGDDLLIATHGRAFWSLDDISALRQFKADFQTEEAHLYTPAPALRLHGRKAPAHVTAAGLNPPTGAVIDFYLKSVPKGESILEFLDPQGRLIRKFSSDKPVRAEGPLYLDDHKPKKQLPLKAGLNRFVWDLRYDRTPPVPGYYLYEYDDGEKGPMALPGTYQVRLTAGGKTLTAPLEVKPDPRVKISAADLQKQFDFLMRVHRELGRVYDTTNQILDVRRQLQGLRHRLPQDATMKPVVEADRSLDQKIEALEKKMINLKVAANEESLDYPLGIDGQWAFLAMDADGDSDFAPTAADDRRFDELHKTTQELFAEWNTLVTKDLAAFQKLAVQHQVHAINVKTF